MPIDIEPDEIDPMIRDLHRLDMNANEAFAFDATFYRALYPDLASLPDDKLADHYRRHGQGESRSSSFAEFALQICDNPREIPLDFNPAEYIDLYVDLKSFAEKSPLEALRHYMCHGRWEPQTPHATRRWRDERSGYVFRRPRTSDRTHVVRAPPVRPGARVLSGTVGRVVGVSFKPARGNLRPLRQPGRHELQPRAHHAYSGNVSVGPDIYSARMSGEI